MNNFSDIRKLEYYTNKNIFVGSNEDFNYRINVVEGKLHVETWRGKLCYDLSEVSSSNDFELTDEGLQQISVWLESESKRR